MRALVCVLAFLCVPGALSAQHEYPATDVENGGRLFVATCAACHGPDGDGVAGVDLPVANGAPCRLVVPSRRGVDWVKWVTEIRPA